MSERLSIDIVMATFNGAPFLVEQLESILAQTAPGWRLLVRDDGSTDGTLAILRDYRRLHPRKILVLDEKGGPLGASLNFGRLLEHADAAYVMFSDQDDVWLPRKIEVTLAKLLELERRFGRETPLMVHTDLTVADTRLGVIAPSLWRYQKTDPRRGNSLSRLLVQNTLAGCTAMINKALRDLALPLPREAVMHDWWLGLVATTFGHLDFVSEPTVMYRQHARNDTGARAWGLRRVVRDVLRGDVRVSLVRIQKQGEAFLHRFHDRLPPGLRKMLEIYAGLEDEGFFSKRYYIVRYGFFHAGLIRNAGRFLTP